MNTFFILGAKYLFLLSPILTGIYFLKLSKDKKREFFIFFLITLPITFLLSLLARELYFDPRPFVVDGFKPLIPHSPDNGFPSDHTLLTAAFAFGTLVFSRKIGLILLGISLFVGVSRIYVGVHHVVDILGSIAIAAFVALICTYFIRYLKNDTISS
jgi:undecaprenyl-diphosphatase